MTDNAVEILVVEDSPTQAEMLKFLLEKNNYHVSVAYNGREALAMMNEHKPVIVISDIIMPEMDGYQLCRNIKENGKLKDIPVILLTALSDPEDVIKGLECGADNFITKPYDEKYLISRIRYMLANRLLHDIDKVKMGIEVIFGGHKYYITSERQQILNLLLSTYETAVQKNLELEKTQTELKALNERLEEKVEERTLELRIEIGERRRAEEKLRIRNRALRTLSQCNQTLIRSKEESELLNKMCRLIVEVGGYCMVWVGFAEQDENKTVRPAAQAGHEDGYLKTMKFTWADNEQCPTGLAIRTGKISSIKSIQAADHARWQDEATRRGYASCIALPLIAGGHTFGALNIYAKEPDAFDEEEVKLLDEMADDIAFGIMALRTRAEHMRAEEALHKSEALLQLQINRMPIGCIMWDTEFRVKSWNPAAENIFGFKNDEAIGKHPYDLIVPKSAEHHIDVIWRSLLDGDTAGYSSVNENITKDGRMIICDWTNTPLKDDGTVIGVLSMVQDITERKRADETRLENERLAYASKAKSDFLASMSHELRTPLNAIIGFSDLMKQGIPGELNEKQKSYIEDILTSGDHLLNLINDILDLSKVEAGKIELAIEKLSVPQSINEGFILVKEKAMRHNVTLKTELDPELEFMEADKQRFKQILFNLLSNAVKFSKPEGGIVIVKTKKEGASARFSISDTGIGIKEKDIGKLFKEFEQIDSGISRKYGGTGLGLAITKKLVELHGGTITVESKYGSGSTFTFVLPFTANRKRRMK